MAFESGNIPKETLDYLAAKKAQSDKLAGKGLAIFLLGFIVVAMVLVVASISGNSTNKPPQTNAAKDAPTLPYQPDESIAQAKAYMATKEYKSVLDTLEGLHPVDAKRPGVQNMITKATHEVQLANLKEERLERFAYVKDYERGLLRAGIDATVRATGHNAETLSITFVLVNRPLVYQIENDHEVRTIWKSHGFKDVHLSDGFGSSWSYELPSE